ncbi:MAG: hypothetical protein ACREQW_02785 [Candidatus Binatia bacterium]
MRDRPLVLKRFVDGAEGQPFYQKRARAKRPLWLRTVTLSFPSGRKAEEIVVRRRLSSLNPRRRENSLLRAFELIPEVSAHVVVDRVQEILHGLTMLLP